MPNHRMFLGLFFSVALLGCKDPPVQPTDTAHVTDPTSPPPVALQPDAHLFRASMAIRGIRPSVEEVNAVRANPDAAYDIIDGYLESPEFGETVKDLWAEQLLVRADTRHVWPAIYDMSWSTDGAMFRAMTEAPLRLIEAVVTEDRPFGEVLTDPHVYAEPVLTFMYGLNGWELDGPLVQPLEWPDERPRAGVLSDTAWWVRHESNGSNFHRGRANQLSSVFLCDNIGSRDIDLGEGLDLSNPAAVSEAVNTEPACISCHETLDPLAAHLWGFKGNLRRMGIFMAYQVYGCEGEPGDYCYPVNFYNLEASDGWSDNNLPAPAIGGIASTGLADLGQKISQDRRFAPCMARQFGGYLLQRDLAELNIDQVNPWAEVFEEQDQSAKKLVREIVWSDEFRGESEQTKLLVIRPEQLSRTLYDLTGFEYLADTTCEQGACWGTVDLLTNSLHGFRSMAGGIDGYQVTKPAHTATPTRHLVMARVGTEAAAFVVNNDFQVPLPADRKLLTVIQPGETDERSVRLQLVALHDRVLGEPLATDHAEIDESWALYSVLLQHHQGDDHAAWTALIAALLQDVRVLFY